MGLLSWIRRKKNKKVDKLTTLGYDSQSPNVSNTPRFIDFDENDSQAVRKMLDKKRPYEYDSYRPQNRNTYEDSPTIIVTEPVYAGFDLGSIAIDITPSYDSSPSYDIGSSDFSSSFSGGESGGAGASGDW